MNTRTTVLTVVILWVIGGVALRYKYIEAASSKKPMSTFIWSYETFFFIVILIAGFMMLQ